MGLLYQLPTTTDQTDHVFIDHKNSNVEIRSYGLPYIFWFYLIIILIILLAMILVIKDPLNKIIETGDSINIFLGYLVWGTLCILPIIILSFYFFEKRIKRNKENLSISFYLFFIKYWEKKIVIEPQNSFYIQHYLDSPNMARINQHPDYKKFQNKGYFELYAKSKNPSQNDLLIDRSSSKNTLEEILLLIQF